MLEKGSEPMVKRVNIHCQYCGSKAVLRSATAVHVGNRRGDGYVYVCARYPFCDSYVGVHPDTRKPMGTLANRALREKRVKAHRAFNQLWEYGYMTKKEAYHWLQLLFGLPEDMAHIAQFSDYRCEKLICACQSFLSQAKRAA